ncbi:hypothetical protein [Sphingobacterium detergens]|uniref:hypothetical protein n=1 Tax=Sphingobacterium detergens TaxID=1145106 RepID=UPI003AABE247
MKTYKLYHRGEFYLQNDSLEMIYIKLQRLQSQSADYALKYGGWKITQIDEQGNETEVNHD